MSLIESARLGLAFGDDQRNVVGRLRYMLELFTHSEVSSCAYNQQLTLIAPRAQLCQAQLVALQTLFSARCFVSRSNGWALTLTGVYVAEGAIDSSATSD